MKRWYERCCLQECASVSQYGIFSMVSELEWRQKKFIEIQFEQRIFLKTVETKTNRMWQNKNESLKRRQCEKGRIEIIQMCTKYAKIDNRKELSNGYIQHTVCALFKRTTMNFNWRRHVNIAFCSGFYSFDCNSKRKWKIAYRTWELLISMYVYIVTIESELNELNRTENKWQWKNKQSWKAIVHWCTVWNFFAILHWQLSLWYLRTLNHPMGQMNRRK